MTFSKALETVWKRRLVWLWCMGKVKWVCSSWTVKQWPLLLFVFCWLFSPSQKARKVTLQVMPRANSKQNKTKTLLFSFAVAHHLEKSPITTLSTKRLSSSRRRCTAVRKAVAYKPEELSKKEHHFKKNEKVNARRLHPKIQFGLPKSETFFTQVLLPT